MTDQLQTPETAPVPVAASVPDKVIELGQVGKIVFDFHEGIGTISISAGAAGLEGGAFIKGDAELIIKAVVDAIQKKLPDGMDPFIDTAESVLINAVKGIK